MHTATFSDSSRPVPPPAIRGEPGLKAGREFPAITKGNVIEPASAQSIRMARGILKGANPDNYRDREEHDRAL